MVHLRNPELALVQDLSGLQSLRISWSHAGSTSQVVQAVCHLTGLRRLDVDGPASGSWSETSLTPLSHLKQLTALCIKKPIDGATHMIDGEVEQDHVLSAFWPAGLLVVLPDDTHVKHLTVPA